jgi:competence protein ComEC
MNYCILILISFAAGIITATEYTLTLEDSAIAATPILSLAVIFLNHKAFQNSNKRIIISLLLVLFFLLGIILTESSLYTPQNKNHIYNKITMRSEAVVSGILTSAPVTINRDSGKSTRFLVKADNLRFAESVTDEQTIGLIQMSMKGSFPAGLQPGDHILVKAQLERPHGFATPGSFDYPRFLSEKSIWITGWVSSPLNIIKLNRQDSTNHLKDTYFRILTYPEKIRYRISNFLDSSLTPPNSSLYKAILIGEKSSIPNQTLENFKASGVMHILAISGMHMSLLFLSCTFLFSAILKRSTRCILSFSIVKTATLLSLIPLIFYALIAGMNTPVLRSLLMSSVFIITIIFNRPRSLINNVAIAALLILFCKPSSLYTVAFQLSFGAVISIALFFPQLELLVREKLLPIAGNIYSPDQSPYAIPRKNVQHTYSTASSTAKLRSWLIAAVIVSTVATLGTAPLLAYYFNRISLLSPFSTIIIEPLVCLWALIWGLIACLLLPFSVTAASYLINVGSLGLSASAWVASQLASVPFSDFYLYTPSLWEIVFYYLLLFSMFHLRVRLVRPLALFAFLSLLLIPISHQLKKNSSSTTKVNYLDVGQGTATVLQFPSGKTALIDGGGPAGESFNIGERVIAPFLWKNRITQLDALIITHGHADHYNGLQFIINQFRPKQIWMNTPVSQNAYFIGLKQAAAGRQTLINIPENGQTLFHTNHSQLQCVLNPAITDGTAPADSILKNVASTENNKSLILKLTHSTNDSYDRSISFLFPGDIDKTLERTLVTWSGDLDADILLAAHHGSSSSNSLEFLQAVSPEFLVVSAGNRADHFPAPDLEERCRKNGITFLLTKNDGTITFETDGTSVRIQKNRFPRQHSREKRFFRL